MRNKAKLTVGLWEGEKQTIEAAAMAMGVSMSEFARFFAFEAAQKVMADRRKLFRGEVVESEFVEEPGPVSQVRQMPDLPNVPIQDTFTKAEKAMQTRFKARSVSRG